MDMLVGLYNEHTFWVWLAVGGAFLAFELHTGSGWMLWPAGSAAVVAIVSLFWHVDFRLEAGLFALLTIATSLAGQRFMRRTAPTTPDINDTSTHLLGHHGEAVTPFDRGRGRVVIQGKEWAAETDNADALQPGAKVEVIGILSGARLKVRSA